MHILIALITAIAGLLWALNRLQDSGVNLNAFNPFWWYRRSQWQKKYGAKPIHTLHRPMDAAALLLVAAVREEGDISREQKQALLSIFEQEFRLGKQAAADLLGASVFLLRDVTDICSEVPAVLAPCRDSFNEQQAMALLALLERVSSLEGAPTERQRVLRETVANTLLRPASNGLWS